MINAIKMHPSVKFAADFSLALTSNKMRERTRFFTSIDVMENIDKKLLPKEYGGEMPMEEMIGKRSEKKTKCVAYISICLLFSFWFTALFKDEIKARQDKILLNDQMKVDLNLYSSRALAGSVGALKRGEFTEEINKFEGHIYGVQGSFRKLEVD